MSPYDKEPPACENCEKLQHELNEMEERLDRERRYGYDVRTELTRLQQHVRELELLHAQSLDAAVAEVERLKQGSPPRVVR